MKREIKFRAWDKKSKEMIFSGKSYEDFDLFVILNKPKLFDVMQFTGLKDKKGKDIYEGDIVNYNNGDCILLIIWNDGWGMFEYDILKQKDENTSYDIRMGRLDCYSKVIGNKYENPDLLTFVKTKAT